MDEKLRILILEDVPSDAELVERELRGAGLAFDSRRVDTRRDFVDALEDFQPNIVLMDYQLPQFDGMSALKLTLERSPTIPVVMVTGSINEETAVECIKAGATDYVIKDHLARLVPAVQGALERHREREARERAEETLWNSERATRLLKEVAVAANEAKGADEALLAALGRVCDFTKWPIGHVYVRARDGTDDLAPTRLWHLDAHERFKVFKELTERTRFAPGVGLPGRVLATGQPAWIVDVTKDPNFPRAKQAKNIGVRGAFGFPVLADEEVVAVLEFFSAEAEAPDETLLEVMAQIGIQLGIVVERMRAEEALRRSEADYRGVVEHATYGIYRSSVDGKLLTVNPALVEMLSYDSREDLLGLDLAQAINADPAQRGALVAQYGERRIQGVEAEWKRKDGTPITVRLSGGPVRNPQGKIEAFEMMVEDVTEQRALEAQLRQSQKMEAVGQLTGGIAHDLNNVLTVILCNVELAANSLRRDQVDLRGDLGQVHDAARRGAELIKKLLGFSRRQVLELKPVDLAQVVEELATMLQRVVPENIEIRVSSVPPLGTIQADPGAVQQMLLNLVTNARDAMPDGGALRIHTEHRTLEEAYVSKHPWVTKGEYACLSVSDTGRGMDERTKQRIFEPFFTTKPAGVGTGLGMAMVYGLVKQHGGSIHVYSELGLGTTMKLYFPVVDEVAVSFTRESGVREMPGGNETILVVEDEEALRRTAERLLTQKGYTVLSASNGEEALQQFRAHEEHIDLVMSDLVMPRLGGLQLYDALIQQGKQVKFLLTSGYSEPEATEGSRLRPGVRLLTKPWTLTELLVCVREVLDSPARPRGD